MPASCALVLHVLCLLLGRMHARLRRGVLQLDEDRRTLLLLLGRVR